MKKCDPLYDNIQALEQLGVSYHNACVIESLRTERNLTFKFIKHLIEKQGYSPDGIIDMLLQPATAGT